MKPSSMSVIIPTYNGEKFIQQAIASVMRQTRLPKEIILVDDCSDDATIKIAEHMKQDARVPLKIFQLSNNSGGPAKPINYGVDRSTGIMTAVLDQDDVYEEDALESYGNALQMNGVSLAFGLCGYFENRRQHRLWGSSLQELFANSVESQSTRIMTGNALMRIIMHHGNVLVGFPGFAFHRSDWNKTGRIDEHWRIAADMNLIGKLASEGSTAFIPRITYLRREHENNVSKDKLRMNAEILRMLCFYLKTNMQFMSEVEILHSVRDRANRTIQQLRENGMHDEANACSSEWYETLASTSPLKFSQPKLLATLLKARIKHLVTSIRHPKRQPNA